MGESLKGFCKIFALTQNKCLRIINGAYKTILTRYLESKIIMLLFDLYFDKWVADFNKRIKVFEISRLLRAAGAKAAVLAAERRQQYCRILARPIKRDNCVRAIN
jgi:hypothetical protein